MTKEQEEARDRLRDLIPHLIISEQLASSPRAARDGCKAMLGIMRVELDGSGDVISMFELKDFIKDLILVTDYKEEEDTKPKIKCKRCNDTGYAPKIMGSRFINGETMPCPGCDAWSNLPHNSEEK